jgi:hypothetical protein
VIARVSRPPLTTALLAVPGGAVVAASIAIVIVVQAYVVPAFTDPSVTGGVGNPAIAIVALILGVFFGAAFGAVIGSIVAGGLMFLWVFQVPDRIGGPVVSVIGVAATVGLMTVWLVDDPQIVLIALSGAPCLVAGVAILLRLGRREVTSGRRFYER